MPAGIFFVLMTLCYTVQSESGNLRLDYLLSSLVPDCSRSYAAGLVSQGQIRVDGQIKKPGYRVKSGETITGELQAPRKRIPSPSPEPLEFPIVHEDPHIIVVNKPAGLVVHPAAGNASGTLVNRLLSHYPQIREAGGDPLRPGIVHRLDKDTSGLMVVGKTLNSLRFLQKEFKQRRVIKQYLALVSGKDLADTGLIDLPISRHPVNRKVMAVNQEAGKPARTTWQVQQRFNNAAQVLIRLHTGRTHQIRVHFYAIGHPLLGDPVYQYRKNRKKNRCGNRQMLHSHALSFRHPYSGQRVAFKSEPPDDYKLVMSKLNPTA